MDHLKKIRKTSDSPFCYQRGAFRFVVELRRFDDAVYPTMEYRDSCLFFNVVGVSSLWREQMHLAARSPQKGPCLRQGCYVVLLPEHKGKALIDAPGFGTPSRLCQQGDQTLDCCFV